MRIERAVVPNIIAGARDSQWEVARQLCDAWLKDRIQLGTLDQPGGLPVKIDEFVSSREDGPVLRMNLARVEEIEGAEEARPFLSTALKRFRDDPRARRTYDNRSY